MSDEKTQNLAGGKSFEERIFARFDALDARLDRVGSRLGKVEARLEGVESRLDKVEARIDDIDSRLQRLEQRAYDTKPIWERALGEILALGETMNSLERKFDVLTRDMVTLRADQRRVEDRMDRLESKPA